MQHFYSMEEILAFLMKKKSMAESHVFWFDVAANHRLYLEVEVWKPLVMRYNAPDSIPEPAEIEAYEMTLPIVLPT